MVVQALDVLLVDIGIGYHVAADVHDSDSDPDMFSDLLDPTFQGGG
jgi:hypothetical protein